MALQSKPLKYTKYQKGSLPKRLSKGNSFLTNGSYGLKSISVGYVTFRQLEAARRVLVRFFKRNVKVWMKVFPNLPKTAKPIEVRMGKGKGAVSHWIFKVSPGRILLEISAEAIDVKKALTVLEQASAKFAVKTKIVRLD